MPFSKLLQSSGITWTAANLMAYLVAPQQVVPGNGMPFAGIANAQQRADIAAYLGTLK